MPELTLANIVQILFVFLGILGSTLLFEKRRFKGVILLLAYFSLLMTFNLLEELNLSKPYLFITPSFTLLLGPILYLMAYSLVEAKQIPFSRLILHGIPSVLSIPFTKYTEFVVAFGAISQLAYLFASYRLLHRYNLAVFNSRSDAEALELSWVARASSAIFLFLVVDMVRLNIRPLLGNEVYYNWYLFDLNILLLICCYLLVKSVKQPEVFDGLKAYERNQEAGDSANNLTSMSNEDEDRQLSEQLFELIDRHIQSSQLYKTPKLSLQQVADELGLAVKQTSWAINKVSGKNFNDYINALRIELVKQQLKAKSGSSSNILDIALECGFNSKSTFNLAFKKSESMTPTQYVSEIRC